VILGEDAVACSDMQASIRSLLKIEGVSEGRKVERRFFLGKDHHDLKRAYSSESALLFGPLFLVVIHRNGGLIVAREAGDVVVRHGGHFADVAVFTRNDDADPHVTRNDEGILIMRGGEISCTETFRVPMASALSRFIKGESMGLHILLHTPTQIPSPLLPNRLVAHQI
jgi:hypothetical protein